MKTNTDRQREYREKRSTHSTRISIWISNKANTNLSALATTQNISREKIIEKLLERAA